MENEDNKFIVEISSEATNSDVNNFNAEKINVWCQQNLNSYVDYVKTWRWTRFYFEDNADAITCKLKWS